ncbi:MAG: ETC complex I subunit [Alphaproteobacteria bacterium]|nr:ETC complex I subunit [Alphaproteobacteria bacterium]
MVAQARIFRPARNAMQSGKAKTKDWVLEFEPAAAKQADPLMGWSGSTDTRGQVRLSFATREEAETHARRMGIAYVVAAPHEPKLKLRAYADNFRYERIR